MHPSDKVFSSMLLSNDEVIIRKGVATHLVPFEGVGGKLFLTNKRLFFESRSLSFQRHEEYISLKDIVAIEAKHSDFISRKLSIYLINDSIEDFLVYRRKSWLSEIQKAIKNLKQETTVYLGIHQKPNNVTPRKRHDFFINLLIRAIFIGVFVGVVMYLLMG